MGTCITCWIFWTPFLCGVKTQMRRLILFYLFKWRGVKLDVYTGSDSFEREKLLQIIERERRGEIIVIFTYPLESIFHIAIAYSFTVGSDWFLDSRFYTHDTSNSLVGSSKWYLERETSVSHSLLYILGFHLLISIVPIGCLFWFDYL